MEKRKLIKSNSETAKEQSFLCGTHCLDLIHITIKFHQEILYGYLVIARIRIVWKKNIKGNLLGNTESKTNHFCMQHTALTSYTLPKTFIKIFHIVTYLWYPQGQSKFHQSKVTQKLRKGGQSFMYATLPINLIHIAIKFHQDILYGNLLMVCIKSVKI